MNILFVHQNFPGQYLYLAPRLARSGHRVVAIANREDEVALPGVQIVQYKLPERRAPGTHRFLVRTEEAVLRGEAVAAEVMRLSAAGFRPDVVCVHPGWGEALYLDDVCRQVPQLHYCEFHFAPFRGPSEFRPRDPVPLDAIFELRVRNAVGLLSLDSCRAGVTPTRWQWSQYPAVWRPRIAVVHDGINVNLARPDPNAVVTLADGRHLTRADRVVTFISRNLEPTRGFPEFMRAAARLLERHPDVEILIIGGDEPSYGPGPGGGRTWREVVLGEVAVDPKRVHFLGKMRYGDYLKVLQISAAHVYLTVPFVLSWSFLEAMAVGCPMVASATPPVEEVMRHGENGLLVDFFDRDGLVAAIEEARAGGPAIEAMREAARRTVVERYRLEHCIPRQIALVERVARMQ